jgi:ArsR family transcriptional regulator
MKQLFTLSQDLEACCPSKSEPALARETAETTASMLKALSDPNRIQILAIINSSENNECCVCDLTEPLGLTQPTVSHHLSKMVAAGLLEKEKRGTWSWYRLNLSAWEKISKFFSTTKV